MSKETRTCDFCGEPFDAFGGVEHLPNCAVSSFAIPLALQSIAESLEKLANPPITFGEALGITELSESEKFFKHLNNGEVYLDTTTLHNSGVYRIVIGVEEGDSDEL